MTASITSSTQATHVSPDTHASPITQLSQARLMPAATDRDAWEVRLQRLGPVLCDELEGYVAQAKAYEIRPILASHYRAYMESGDRLAFEAVLHGRRMNLSYLAVGAGVLGDDTCLGPLEDLIWSTCEETTWVTPPVARGLPSYQPADFEVELTPAMTGLLLSSIDHLLGERLDPRVRQRINQCLLERVIRPILEKDYWWLNPVPPKRFNNWTSVCAAGALACATLVPALNVWRERVIDRCLQPLKDYMETFDEEGCTEEGSSYWVYSVDYLTLAAELLRLDPAGPDLYEYPRFKPIARFLPHQFLGNRQWITFSDCRQTPRVNAGTLAKLDERLDVPQTGCLARRCDAHLDFLAKEATLLHALAWWPEHREGSSQAIDQSVHDSQRVALPAQLPAQACVYFPGVQWMISRHNPDDSDTLVLSAHAGHNGFSHNHNDVGHVSVYSRTLPLLVDLGVPVYDRDYFSEKRMTYFVASSKGHSVPQVNGQLQLRGEQYTSKVISQSHGKLRDEIVMDLKNVYSQEAGLASLTRAISLTRTNPAQSEADAKGQVNVTDDFAFESDQPGRWQFISAAITTGAVSLLSPGQILIENGLAKGLFTFDDHLLVCQLEKHMQVKLKEGVTDCTRLCLSLRNPAKVGRVSWSLTPI